ncbi:MAG TPA: SpoIID/LytB domain-containing protein [Candidatus Binatia bacterium]|nr:SpoIID/LytB domain-containing protein [Candidatus Binatia bacterium]
MRIRRALLLLTVAVALVCAPAGNADSRSASASAVVIAGHGFGHGIGLSQWGAEERAAAGQSTGEILSFYYPGTSLQTVGSRTVRVWLTDAPSVAVGSTAPFRVRDSSGQTLRLGAGLYRVGAAGLNGRPLPLVVLPGSAPVRLGGTGYHGTLALSQSSTGVQVVNGLDLEQYVADVVSSENPGYWHPAALQAQAIASRSYALASIKPQQTFDVYPDDRSQNYHGLAKELPRAVDAARATSGKVLTYGGQVVTALFTAANGGVTGVPQGIWSSTSPPYFVARPDPFDARSPDTNWGPLRLPVSKLRNAFPQLPAAITAVSLTRNAADRAVSLSFSGADGSVVQISGYAFQQKLGLRSTWFSVAPSFG